MSDLLANDGDLAIRLLRDEPSEYELMHRWLREPHVHEWWGIDDPMPSYEAVVAEYRPYVTGGLSTACVITVGTTDIGYIQFYRWADDPTDAAQLGITLPDTAWGIDVFIGDTAFVGKGYGQRAVGLTCAYLAAQLGATEVDLVTAQANTRAQKSYVSAGFGYVSEVLDTDTKDGERILSWLMRWRPDPPA